MNRKELIFIAIAIIILLVCISTMPQYYFAFIFLLVLAILFFLMTVLAKYKRRFENRTLSIVAYTIAIILFIVYFANSINITGNASSDSSLILLLFFLVMCIGWIFEKNKS
jgi:hypothetical protein